MTMPSFSEAGFLSQDPGALEATVADNAEWFRLACDVNAALMRIIMTGMNADKSHGSNWSKEAVAMRLLMRSSGSFQGAILLAKQSMATQARMLVRSIVEDSFFAGALLEKPDEVIRMLRADAEASRRSQGRFILEQKLGNDPAALERLESAIAEIDAQAKMVNYRGMAKLSSMLPQYLNYQRLSDDSVHTSASSLNKHLRAHDGGWSYQLCRAGKDDITSTLHRAVLAVLPVGIVVTQLLSDDANNVVLADLGERFRIMPTGSTI